MAFLYASLGCIEIFPKKLHPMHSSVTAIFHKDRIVNVVIQPLIIDLIHQFVYQKKNIESSDHFLMMQ